MKQAAAARFPSLLVRWRRIRRPRSAEAELSLLHHIVSPGDVTVDVGANFGLYTCALARLSAKVHAFEPSRAMADLLRRTSPANVVVHEMALSDREGKAELRVPRDGPHLAHGLATIETGALTDQDFSTLSVWRARLDTIVRDTVSFVKIDVEGHEHNVLLGAAGLINRSRPVFLVEVEERHRQGATGSVFEFFQARGYNGYFLCDDTVFGIDVFDPRVDQDASVLLADGGRRKHCHYINNFFFFPAERDRSAALTPERASRLRPLRETQDGGLKPQPASL